MSRLAVSAVLALGACSDLDTIQTPLCGNGAVEDGEECDSSDTQRCENCELKCDAGYVDDLTGLDIRCPHGFTCAVDGFCRAPSGVLHENTGASFPVNDFAVSDVNWDGTGDVVGVTSTSITLLHGDPAIVESHRNAALFTSQATTVTPLGRGDPAFGDFDGDGRIDVLLPTADGIAAYSSKHRTLAPHAFSFDPAGHEDMMGAPALVFSFSPDYVAFLFGDEMGVMPGLGLAMLGVTSGQTGPGQFGRVACTTLVAKQLSYDAYLIQSAPPVQAVIAVRDIDSRVCAFRVTIPGPGSDPFAVTSLFEGIVTGGTTPAWADLDGAGCPSLLVAPGKELRAQASSPCALASTITSLPPQVVGMPVGRVPIVTALPNAAPDAIVTSAGVFAVTTSRAVAQPLYMSDRPIDDVEFGDLDADGRIDAVLSADSSFGLDVLFAGSGGGFLLYRIATSGFVTNLATGDFDGNAVADIVYTERVDNERLLVAYGTRDRPLPPIEMGRFSKIGAFLPAQIPDSVDINAAVLDLAIVDRPTEQQFLLTILHGSPQRTMLSYFDPRSGGGPSTFAATSAFYSAAVGQFMADPAPAPAASDAPDVIAIEWLGDKRFARLYKSYGRNASLVATATGTMTEGWPVRYNLGNVAVGSGCELDPSAFCLDRARYISVARAPYDVVIGVDRRPAPHAISIAPAQLAPTTSPGDELLPNVNLPRNVPGLAVGAGFVLVSLRAADVDGDGREDVIASFAADAQQPSGEVRVCLADDFTTCPSIAELAGLPRDACLDVVPAQIQRRGRFGPHVPRMPGEPVPLAALCRSGSELWLYRIAKAGERYLAEPLIEMQFGARRLEAGDVNGDGTDDVLVLERTSESAVPYLRPYLQCPSTDDACMATPTARSEEVMP